MFKIVLILITETATEVLSLLEETIYNHEHRLDGNRD
ncbi:MAG: hypothetical protein N5P05_001218 [Chroococcopsis gigantea SAG 12.99]|nr:hypothetical protein [Chroococcopsis gigantea SAG 12.99]